MRRSGRKNSLPLTSGSELAGDGSPPSWLYTLFASLLTGDALPPKMAPVQGQQAYSALSFVPEGVPRSVAEYAVALMPGAILLEVFFIAAQATIVFVEGSLLSIVFIPVICVVPFLSGVVAALALEKIRRKPLIVQRGAAVGACSSLLGSLLSTMAIAVMSFATGKYPFGISGIAILIVAFAAISAMAAILGALGGAVVANFIKE